MEGEVAAGRHPALGIVLAHVHRNTFFGANMPGDDVTVGKRQLASTKCRRNGDAVRRVHHRMSLVSNHHAIIDLNLGIDCRAKLQVDATQQMGILDSNTSAVSH